jgi:hypothetical protein
VATTEHTINDAIASLLRETRNAWRTTDVVSSENTAMLTGSNKRPDILVLEPTVSPVVIETEVQPATTVESDALARLGEHLRTNGRQILSSVAIQLPLILKQRSGDSLRRQLQATTDLRIAVYAGTSAEKHLRWPRSGWLSGSIADLSLIAQSAWRVAHS